MRDGDGGGRVGGYLVRGGGDAEDEAVGEVGAGHLRLAPRAPHCSGGRAEWWSCWSGTMEGVRAISTRRGGGVGEFGSVGFGVAVGGVD